MLFHLKVLLQSVPLRLPCLSLKHTLVCVNLWQFVLHFALTWELPEKEFPNQENTQVSVTVVVKDQPKLDFAPVNMFGRSEIALVLSDRGVCWAECERKGEREWGDSIVRGYLRNVNGAIWWMEKMEYWFCRSLSLSESLFACSVWGIHTVSLCVPVVYNSCHRKTLLIHREKGTLCSIDLQSELAWSGVWGRSRRSYSTHKPVKAKNTRWTLPEGAAVSLGEVSTVSNRGMYDLVSCLPCFDDCLTNTARMRGRDVSSRICVFLLHHIYLLIQNEDYQRSWPSLIPVPKAFLSFHDNNHCFLNDVICSLLVLIQL